MLSSRCFQTPLFSIFASLYNKKTWFKSNFPGKRKRKFSRRRRRRKYIYIYMGKWPLSNKVKKESLKPGDHIYSWRTAYIYAHHGIYVGENTVIHFTAHGQGSMSGPLSVDSGAARSVEPCPNCGRRDKGSGVVASCLDCFLAGGNLNRFKYAVSHAHFVVKGRGGTCTLSVADPNDLVVHRAKYLLENGFGCYNVFKNNCEDFAIYCKTGLLVLDERSIGQSGQAGDIIGGPLAAVTLTALGLLGTNVFGIVAMALGVYYTSRFAADIGMKRVAKEVPVEDLTTSLATGSLRVVESQMSASPIP